MTVSVPVSANPQQILDAFKKIQDAAKQTGRDLRNVGDIGFPGLEEAQRTLLDLNRGFEQMLSKAVRGKAAETVRAGHRGGMYGPDIVSWWQNAHRMYPDDKERERHVQAVIAQASRLSSMPGMSGGLPGLPGGVPPGGGGSGAGAGLAGLAGMLPWGKVLGMLGVGTGLNFISQQVGQAGDEAVGMSDLRRTVGDLNTGFLDFRDNIRKAGDGLGVTYEETVKLAREYAQLSGAMSGEAASMGTNEGIKLARMFGLQAGQGASMMGRAGWLGVGGSSPQAQARILAEAMAGSGMGARQAEAAEAMLRYTERASQTLAGGGDARTFMGMFHALTNSGIYGLRANAEGIIGGMDASIKTGGRAGVAGQNFTWNMLSRHGVTNPFKAEALLEQGISGMLPDGKTPVWRALMDGLREKYQDPDMRASAAKRYFGISMSHWKELEKLDLGKATPKEFAAKIAEIEKDLKKGDLGQDIRNGTAELSRELNRLLGERLLPIVTDSKELLATIAHAINATADFLVPGHRRDRERRENLSKLAPMTGMIASGAPISPLSHPDQSIRSDDREMAELAGRNAFRSESRKQSDSFRKWGVAPSGKWQNLFNGHDYNAMKGFIGDPGMPSYEERAADLLADRGLRMKSFDAKTSAFKVQPLKAGTPVDVDALARELSNLAAAIREDRHVSVTVEGGGKARVGKGPPGRVLPPSPRR